MAAIALALSVSTPQVYAQENAASGEEAAPPVLSVEEQLDEAFEILRSSQSVRAAKRAEQKILRLWLDTDSDTIDLLMSWALRAIDDENYALALDYLDRIIVMKPDFAEAWNKRATVHFLNDRYDLSIADIDQVLRLEPRHFGAMSGLGIMLSEIGDKERAREVFGRALEIDPHLEDVREALAKLEDEMTGTDI